MALIKLTIIHWQLLEHLIPVDKYIFISLLFVAIVMFITIYFFPILDSQKN